jgi:hypothetical protein
MITEKSMDELKKDLAIYHQMETNSKAVQHAVADRIKTVQEEYALEKKKLAERFETLLKELQQQYEASWDYERNVIWTSAEEQAYESAWDEIERRDYLNGVWKGKKGGSIHFVKDNNTVPDGEENARPLTICGMIDASKLVEGQGKRVCQFCINMTEHIRTRESHPYFVPSHPEIDPQSPFNLLR